MIRQIDGPRSPLALMAPKRVVSRIQPKGQIPYKYQRGTQYKSFRYIPKRSNIKIEGFDAKVRKSHNQEQGEGKYEVGGRNKRGVQFE